MTVSLAGMRVPINQGSVTGHPKGVLIGYYVPRWVSDGEPLSFILLSNVFRVSASESSKAVIDSVCSYQEHKFKSFGVCISSEFTYPTFDTSDTTLSKVFRSAVQYNESLAIVDRTTMYSDPSIPSDSFTILYHN